MKRGELARFTIPPNLAYGAYGFPAWKIPPNASLVFEIRLVDIAESQPGLDRPSDG